ncbi:MAG: VanZ family protein [Lachnospiraceae bacterium]|nr:VanZ family protein [Lachnospiraceae bacterium]
MVIIEEILGYFLIGFILIAVLSVFYIPFYFLLRKKIPLIRQIVYFLFGACVFIILSATVFIGINIVPAGRRTLNIIPFRVFTESWEMGFIKKISQTFANIVMFMPLGFIFPVAFKKARKLYTTTIYMALFSFLIEFVQYFIGRSSDIDDFMLNTLGGISGYFIFFILSRVFENKSFWKKLTGTIKQV